MNEKLNSNIDKTLSVLEVVASNSKGVSLADIVKSVAIPKTTAFRVLEVLTGRDYVNWNPIDERYYLGIKTLEIGMTGLIGQDIVDVSIPYLRELSNTVGETSFLAVYNSGDVVYLYKAEGTSSIQTTAHLGTRRPAYCTALGKAILANLPIEESDRIFEKSLEKLTEKTVTDRVKLYAEFSFIRTNGYSIDDEGVEYGLYCLAVPIFNFTGGVVAAISVSGPIQRICENKERVIDELKSFGAVISKRLGFVKTMRLRT